MPSLETSGDKYLSIDGLSIRYWDAGDLDSIPSQRVKNHRLVAVFFHGFSFSLDDWKKTGTLASVSSSGYQVLAVDLPKGKTSKSGKLSYADVNRYVPIIESVFTKLNVGARSGRSIVIIGPSMGGGFALAYALAHADRVAGLVLISPALDSVDEENMQNLDVPVMLVWGENDEVFPVKQYAEPLRMKLRNSKLIIIKNAGHAAYLDKPEDFNDRLIDFLSEIS